MSFKTAIKEYGLFGILRMLFCIPFGHDFNIGKVCLYCDELMEEKDENKNI